MAIPVGNSIPPSGNPLVDGLLQGGSWQFPDGNRTITYGLLSDSFHTFNSANEQAIAGFFTVISAYINVKFQEVPATDLASDQADITLIPTGYLLEGEVPGLIGLTAFPDPAATDALLASLGATRNQDPNAEGDVFLDNFASAFTFSTPGSLGWTVMMHEVLHALGLKHPFDDGGTGRPTFAQLGIGNLNSRLYTDMSYDINNGALSSDNYATPALLDVQALQYIYGANRNFRTGNDVWSLTDNGANAVLWDAGGNNTIDASASTAAVQIDLHQGGLLKAGNTLGAIAYGSVVQNAVGSPFNDLIVGNDVANSLAGGAGNDTIIGGSTGDTIDGGSGNDSITAGAGLQEIIGGSGNDTIVTGSGTDLLLGGTGADRFVISSNSPLVGIFDFNSLEGDKIAWTHLSGSPIASAAVAASFQIDSGGNTFLWLGKANGQDAWVILVGTAHVQASDLVVT